LNDFGRKKAYQVINSIIDNLTSRLLIFLKIDKKEKKKNPILGTTFQDPPRALLGLLLKFPIFIIYIWMIGITSST
jgi:hypothetical protein